MSSPAYQQFQQLKQAINQERIAFLVAEQQKGQLSLEDKHYYENLINQFVELVKLPDASNYAMQLLPEFKMTVPVLLDGMAFSALNDKNPKACVFACYMIDQSLLQRDLTPLFQIVIELGTPDLWVQLVKTVNNAPAEMIVTKVYQSDKTVQDYWEQHILTTTEVETTLTLNDILKK